MSSKLELIKKIKALAERGEGGEKDSAQKFLARMMEKYGISESDLEAEKRQTVFIAYHSETERRLLLQIIFMVTGELASGCIGAYTKRARKKLGIDCTAAEHIEIESAFEFYKVVFEKELEIFISAFMNKNDIFPPPGKSKIEKSSEPGDRARAMKVAQMMEGMDRHTLLKQIGQNEE